jgi:hypothetical protein
MKPPKFFLRLAPVAFALCAGFLLMPAGRAQPAPQAADNRFLFIFDTSADMKKRLPAVQAEVNELLASSMDGLLRAGDSLGVWTFGQELRAGQFPLQHWRPEDAVTIAASINQFIGKQSYAGNTGFNTLQPQLNQLIQNSTRLTVLIFCDGEDEIKWTPYDARINQIFQQQLAAQNKTRQPFVLVFRTQLGQFIGCTINFPPGMVSVPEFPPLPPPPPAPAKTPPPTPVVTPPPVGQPLIIIGTKVETNRPPAPAPPPPAKPATVTPTNIGPVMPTNIVPAATSNPVAPPLPTNPVSAVQSNGIPAPSANSFAPTNPVAPPKPVVPTSPTNPTPVIQIKTNAAPVSSAIPLTPIINGPVTGIDWVPVPGSIRTAPTNAVAPSPEPSGLAHAGALVIGGALLVAAGALAALAVFRGRRTDRGSLISRAMRKD